MNIVAYAVHGLEDVLAKEINDTLHPIGLEKLTKRLYFATDQDLSNIMQLRTAEDVGLLVLRQARATLELTLQTLPDLLKSIDWIDIKGILSKIRELDNTFSITVSTVKVKEASSADLKAALATALASQFGWQYTELVHDNFDIRISIDEAEIVVAVKIGSKPLYQREYKQDQRTGSLRTTIAAAMVQMVTAGSGPGKVIDNFCGGGTILCEAFMQGHQVYGSDIDSYQLADCKSNLQRLRFKEKAHLVEQSAVHTKWPTHFFDYAISNPPWNVQIKVNSFTDLYNDSLAEYKRILKPDGKICIITTKTEIVKKYAGRVFPQHTIEINKISFDGQSPSIILIKPRL